MKGELISIIETHDGVKIWVNGQLVYNIHGLGKQVILNGRKTEDLLVLIFQTDPYLLPTFMQQLRLMGLFKEES